MDEKTEESAPQDAGQEHEALFRLAFGCPVDAASVIASALPAEFVEQIDFSQLRPLPGSFVDDEFRAQHTDALYTVKVRDDDVLIHVLRVHQSRPDPLMAFRVLDYTTRIWDAYLEQHGGYQLPLVVPIVLYRGSEPWTAARNFADLVHVPPQPGDALDRVVPRLGYALVDISAIDIDQLRER